MNNTKRNISVELLETREMLAGDSPYISIWLSDGELNVKASKNPAEMLAEVTEAGTSIQVSAQVKNDFGSWSSESHTFQKSQVKSINMVGTKGNDRLANNTSIPSFIQGLGGSNTVHGGSAADVIYGGGGWEDSTTVHGGAGNDEIFGGHGNDFLYGDGGIDHLNGGQGNDYLNGGASNDYFEYGTDQGWGYHQGTDTIDDGVGFSRLDFRKLAWGVILDLNVHDVQKVGGEHLSLKINQNSKVDFVFGSQFNDWIRGNELNNRLYGEGGNDTLEGRAGNDLYHGGIGDDTYDFVGTNLGSDRIANTQGTNALNFSGRPLGVKIDLENTNVQTYGSDGSKLRLISNRVATGVWGSAYNDDIRGSRHINFLSGGSGDDIIEGRGGSDTIWLGYGNDQVVYAGNGHLGTDTFDYTLDYNTLNFMELSRGVKVDLAIADTQLVASGLKLNFKSSTAFYRVLGSAFNDSLKGNDLLNVLGGHHGNDTLEGRGGNDYLFGGNQNDRYVFSGNNLGTDRISGTTNGVNTLDFSDFQRSVVVNLANTSQQIVSVSNLELIIESVTAINHVLGSRNHDVIKGNNIRNIIKGNGGNDTLYGGGANDWLVGGAGRDGLFGGAGADDLDGGSGPDRILLQNGDTVLNKDRINDAHILFRNGRDPNTGVVKKWTDAEIGKVDAGLKKMHLSAGTRFLKANNGDDFIFIRERIYDGNHKNPASILAANDHGSEKMRIYNSGFTSSHIAIAQTVVHEIGHEWDENREGPLFQQFVHISGWNQVNNKWVHDPSATFARNYGKTSPREDIATAWAAYFYGSHSVKASIPQKLAAIDQLFKSYSG